MTQREWEDNVLYLLRDISRQLQQMPHAVAARVAEQMFEFETPSAEAAAAAAGMENDDDE